MSFLPSWTWNDIHTRVVGDTSQREVEPPSDGGQSSARGDPRIESLLKEVESLKNDNKSLLEDNEALRDDKESLQTTVDSLQKSNVEFAMENKDIRAEYDKQRLEIKELRDANKSLEAHAEDLQNRLTSSEEALHQAEARHRDETKLLNQRISELETALPFFSTITPLSQLELKGKVESLNEEILKQASLISDSVIEHHERDFVDDETDRNWTKILIEEGVLDPSLVNALRSPKLESEHLQIALRAAMVHAALQVITTLDPEHQAVGKLSLDISHAERYPIFAEWRTITHAQLSRTIDYKTPSARLFESFVMAVLTVAGWDNQITSLNLRGRLHQLVNVTMELNKIFMQDAHAVQLKFLAFSSSTRFNSMTMDDEDLSREVGINHHVLCTTSLGLASSLVDPQDLDGLDPRWEYPLKAGVITARRFTHLSGRR